ncbi:unnamed protein product, partial [Ranitomeya imitator]
MESTVREEGRVYVYMNNGGLEKPYEVNLKSAKPAIKSAETKKTMAQK